MAKSVQVSGELFVMMLAIKERGCFPDCIRAASYPLRTALYRRVVLNVVGLVVMSLLMVILQSLIPYKMQITMPSPRKMLGQRASDVSRQCDLHGSVASYSIDGLAVYRS